MTRTRPMYVASLTEGEAEAGYLILRDGTTAMIRLAESKDRSALQMFVEGLAGVKATPILFRDQPSC